MRLNLTALEELVRSSGFVNKENSVSWICICPLCSKKDKLYIRKSDGRFVCWTCRETQGFSGRPEYALKEMTGLPLSELNLQLYGMAGYRSVPVLELNFRDFYGDDEEDENATPVLDPMVMPLDFYPVDHKHAQRGRDYLAGRGIDVPLALEYGLRYCPSDRRVIFPMMSQGVCYGWQARAVFETEGFDEETMTVFSAPKILTPKTAKRELMLMFGERLTQDHACLFEGPVDGIKGHLCGGNVVTMGKGISLWHLQLLRNAGVKRVYLASDLDAIAEANAVARSISDLEVYQMWVWGLNWNGEKKAKDFGDMSLEAVFQAYQQAEERSAGKIFARLESDFSKVEKSFRKAEEWKARQRSGKRG